MAELKSMKIDKAEREARYKEMEKPDSGPAYPYELRLHLGDEIMKKLGLSELPAPGKQVMIYALADVTEVGKSDSLIGGSNEHMTLQITEMCVEKPPAKSSDAGKALYGE